LETKKELEKENTWKNNKGQTVLVTKGLEAAERSGIGNAQAEMRGPNGRRSLF